MSWSQNRYYSRSRKVNGRVYREYVGCGIAGQMAAQFDALERERLAAERAAKRKAWEDERAELEALDAQLQALGDLADLVARAALVAAGFQQHKRGEWRKKRVRRDEAR